MEVESDSVLFSKFLSKAYSVIVCTKKVLLGGYIFSTFCLWFDECVPVHIRVPSQCYIQVVQC